MVSRKIAKNYEKSIFFYKIFIYILDFLSLRLLQNLKILKEHFRTE